MWLESCLRKSSATNITCKAITCVGKIGKKRGFCTNLDCVAGVRLRGVVCGAMVCSVVWQWCSKVRPLRGTIARYALGWHCGKGVLDCVLLDKFLAYNFLVLQSLL